MVRTLSVLLPVALAASAVNAQLGDFISNLLGGVGRVATQQNPLAGILSDAVTRNTREITSENWKSSVNVTVDATAAEGDAQEWLLYFTTQPQSQNKTVPAIRNVTYWDGIYNDTVASLSAARPASKVHFGKVDCANPATTDELCKSFFLTSGSKLPVFYHVATYYQNASIEIRRVPWNKTIAASEQPVLLSKFVTEKEWKTIEPWTGVFNPIDGMLKDYTPYLALALKYYDMLPQWAFMVIISLVGRQFSSRMAQRVNPQAPPRPGQAPAPAAAA